VFYGDNNATAYYLSGSKGWGPTFGSIPAVLLTIQVSPSMTRTGFNLTFSTVSNFLYDVQCTTNLCGHAWSTIISNIPGTGFPTNYIDPAVNVRQKFYRLNLHF